MRLVLAILVTLFLLVGTGDLVFAQYDTLVLLETNQGQIVMEFFPDDAPGHVANFIDLTESGFYDGTLFHRIIPGFMIQGGDPNTIDGDPNTWGTGGPDTLLEAEFNDIKHNRGIVSMARATDPDSAGSQFFIVHNNSNFLDQQYTVFARIVTEESFDTLDKIASVETIKPGDAPVNPEQVRIAKASVIERSDMPNLMQLGEPERVAAPTGTIQNQLYQDTKLGIAFSAPPGWLLQQPDKLDEHTPDIVAVGPKTGSMNPVISLTVNDTNEITFDELVQQKNLDLEATPDIQLEIISQEKSTIHDRDAFTTIVTAVFQADIQTDLKLKEVMIYDSEKYYTLLYTNGIDNFDAQLPLFEESLEALELPETVDFAAKPMEDMPDKTNETMDETAEGGGCLIATAAFGSELAPQVQLLREIRDSRVMSTASGAAFMSGFNQFYYLFSPAVADLERQSPVFRDAVKLAITPMLYTMPLLNNADAGSEYDILGYGLAVIALNIGMYVAAPAIFIYKIRK